MKAMRRRTGELLEVEGEFFTAYVRPVERDAETLGQHTITEMAYVPPKVQIHDMIDAGSRLAAERRARFDSRDLNIPDGEDVPVNPLREPGIDLVDAQRVVQGVRSRLEAARRVAAERKAKEGKNGETVESAEGRDPPSKDAAVQKAEGSAEVSPAQKVSVKK